MRKSLLVVPFVALLVGCQGDDSVTKEEKAALKGKWQVVSVDDSAMKVPGNLVKGMYWTFSEDKLTVSVGGQVEEAVYTINPTKKPKQFNSDLAEPKQMAKGIYKLDGDTLVICISTAYRDRPQAFEPDKQLKSSVIRLERVKD
ncbi:hypothetical protein AYO44_06730 [Planctomycetaceae bacterium SCGC AG-212-F19]|nr:hypothetical protein AYO44_06730 [Planctomycetaceae bacterium SCGC AG-212-F19]